MQVFLICIKTGKLFQFISVPEEAIKIFHVAFLVLFALLILFSIKKSNSGFDTLLFSLKEGFPNSSSLKEITV